MARAALIAFLVACSTQSNPPTLWLATNPDETQMFLVGEEPHPY